MTNLNRLNRLILAALFFSKINSTNFFMRKYISNNNKIINCNLVKYIHFVFVIFMDHKSDMSTWKLEIQGLFLLLFELWLSVITRDHMTQFTVVCFTSQLHEHLNKLWYLVLMKKHVELIRFYWKVKLNSKRLRVRTVDCALPTFLVDHQVLSRVSWMLTCHCVDPISHLTHF